MNTPIAISHCMPVLTHRCMNAVSSVECGVLVLTLKAVIAALDSETVIVRLNPKPPHSPDNQYPRD